MFNVLFVCTGNICRSPTAEAVFRARVAAAGLAARIGTGSAGIGDWHVGEAPDPRTRDAASARGYDLSRLRARQVRTADFEDFDLLLAMDHGHERALRRLAPPARLARVGLFLDYAPGAGPREVPDPYYGGADGFALVLDLVEAGVAGLLKSIRDRV
ncbi:MAG: low molecular weight phosphotyrosine protein phosphatase [Alphaproteobacteria bacterium]|nr:low molecular weight phosphotyrosine protein phosphatase [Alphaproteobacteria bacterium]